MNIILKTLMLLLGVHLTSLAAAPPNIILMMGDDQLPLDSKWKNRETLLEWPEWFKNDQRTPGGQFTHTTNCHYTQDSPLQPAGLLGPVRILSSRDGK